VKKYQTGPASAAGLVMPEQVSLAMSEIAESTQEGLLALAGGAGLQRA
jgi:hypothetical protein